MTLEVLERMSGVFLKLGGGYPFIQLEVTALIQCGKSDAAGGKRIAL